MFETPRFGIETTNWSVFLSQRQTEIMYLVKSAGKASFYTNSLSKGRTTDLIFIPKSQYLTSNYSELITDYCVKQNIEILSFSLSPQKTLHRK